MSDALDYQVDATGELRRMGCLLPPAGFVSSFPAFEDKIPLLEDADIKRIAQSGDADGRNKFDVTWIQDQRSHGSCNGFAGAMALSRARVRRGLERVTLSGAYLYSLINGGQDRGSALEDGMRALAERGCATLATVGWDAVFPSQYDRAKADAEAARFRAFECYAVKSLQGLWSALALGFDCVVAVHAGSNFMRVNSQGVAGVDNGPGNHAVLCDGLTWEGGELVGTGANSWNVNYGVNGRMGLRAAHFAQTFSRHVFFALRSTSDDPNGNNPPAAN